MMTVSQGIFAWLSCMFMSCPTYDEVNFNSREWIKITKADVYIKKIQIAKDRHRRGVIELQNFSDSNIDGVMSMELLTEYDCKRRTFRLVNYRGFELTHLQGKMMYNWQGLDPRAFVGIPLESITFKVFELVCGYTRRV